MPFRWTLKRFCVGEFFDLKGANGFLQWIQFLHSDGTGKTIEEECGR